MFSNLFLRSNSRFSSSRLLHFIQQLVLALESDWLSSIPNFLMPVTPKYDDPLVRDPLPKLKGNYIFLCIKTTYFIFCIFTVFWWSSFCWYSVRQHICSCDLLNFQVFVAHCTRDSSRSSMQMVVLRKPFDCEAILEDTGSWRGGMCISAMLAGKRSCLSPTEGASLVTVH